ncbi:Lpg1974 family pore-forming outer membrane protein [Legionella clemsonensis]|uniref:Legionella pneumophila major outer membrane protein n=1 Tax=Legionella clemsonensis TaxID=1867846 RepID=A0A222P5X8_9GAMM|nr:Lpg1974 family pore-forming outer membrane protein [Legionella clemsonensis]ASQ47185.1 Legionella pneumophila major outer membrane protein precursor [Legionella clemsonensis]
MLRLKRGILAVLMLGSSPLFAGSMGPVCSPGTVTVPCEWSGWDFGVKALYLKPAYDVDYGYGPFATVDGITRHYIDTDPDWHWGFMLEASYRFSTGNDLNLNWSHWDDNRNNYSYAGAFVSGFAGALFGTTQFEPEWDAVNLEFGQHVDFGEFKDIRFHAGVQFAHIEHETRASGYSTIIPATLPFSFTIDSQFNGFGPRVGSDMTYNIGHGLAIYGKGAAAILVGTGKFNAGVTVPTLVGMASSGSKTTIVPELETKLGAKYGWVMTQGTLTLDAGWMLVHYFNANHFMSVFGTRNESGFALQGPYVGLNWLSTV